MDPYGPVALLVCLPYRWMRIFWSDVRFPGGRAPVKVYTVECLDVLAKTRNGWQCAAVLRPTSQNIEAPNGLVSNDTALGFRPEVSLRAS